MGDVRSGSDHQGSRVYIAVNDRRVHDIINLAAERAGLIFATIAFSVLISLNLIYFGGLTLNLLTLMGLALGIAWSTTALGASLAPILELGVEAIQAHVAAFNDALEAGLVERGFTLFAQDGIKTRALPWLLKLEQRPEGQRVISKQTAAAVRSMLGTVVQPGGTAVQAAVSGSTL